MKGTETMRRNLLHTLAAVGIALASIACGSQAESLTGGENVAPGGENGGAGGQAGTGEGSGGGTMPGTDPTSDPAQNPNLVQRKLDYGEALRSASLKLVNALPTLAQIKSIQDAPNDAAKKTVYEAELDKLLADPRFTTRMIQWWRDTFRTGRTGAPAAGQPDLDTAAVFAAQLVVEDRPYTELFTATANNCPTFANGTFTPVTCNNAAPAQAGVLTNPGIMAQYYANMAFRRVRFVQETFACTKFPAEYTKTPTPMGASLYTSPWSFDSITGGTGSRIDFKDTSSVNCANCHTTMNHLAPLFGNFSATGQFVAATVQVETPVVSNDPAVKRTRLTDWLPAGQATAWRNGAPAANLTELGAAMARDPDVAKCAVNRVWNWAMSRGDIVNDLSTIPDSVTAPLVTDFTSNGMKMKRLIRNAFTAEDFVKF